MVNLISSLLEELLLAVGSEEIARVPSTLRDQSHQEAAEESHQRQVARQQSHINGTSKVCKLAENSLFERGHHRKSLGIEITMLEQARVIASHKYIGLEKYQ